jgi:signal transduction histidine kinase
MPTLLGFKPANLIEAVLDEVEVGLLIIDQSGQVVMVNRAAIAMFGGDDPTGRNVLEWRETYKIQDRQGREIPLDQAPLMRILQGEDLDPQDICVILPDGRTKWIHSASYQFTVLGLRGVFVIFADETKQVELRRAMELLQRTEVVGRMAGAILHDFNNMLSVSSANVALALADRSMEEATRDYLENASLALQKGSSLARRLTKYSRTEPLEVRPVDLNATIAASLELVRPLVDRRVRVNLELQSDLPSVEADASEIEQVFVNLILNGLDAMPQGGALTLRTEVALKSLSSTGDSNEFVVITIADTGVGIPPDLHSKIFEPFFTTKPDGLGTGLGLSNAYAVVHHHGGDIEVQSTLGAGSRFRVYLPLVSPLKFVRENEKAA